MATAINNLILKDIASGLGNGLGYASRNIAMYAVHKKLKPKIIAKAVTKGAIITTGYLLENRIQFIPPQLHLISTLTILSTVFLSNFDFFADYEYGTIKKCYENDKYDVKLMDNSMKLNVMKKNIRKCDSEGNILRNLSYNYISTIFEIKKCVHEILKKVSSTAIKEKITTLLENIVKNNNEKTKFKNMKLIFNLKEIIDNIPDNEITKKNLELFNTLTENFIKQGDLVGVKYDLTKCTKEASKFGLALIVNYGTSALTGSNIAGMCGLLVVRCAFTILDNTKSKYQKIDECMNTVAIIGTMAAVGSATFSLAISVFSAMGYTSIVALTTLASITTAIVGGIVMFVTAYIVPFVVSRFIKFFTRKTKFSVIEEINDIIDGQPLLPNELKIGVNDSLQTVTKKFHKISRIVHPDKRKQRNLNMNDTIYVKLREKYETLITKFKSLHECRDYLDENSDDVVKSKYFGKVLDWATDIFSTASDNAKAFFKKEENMIEGVDIFSSEFVDFMLLNEAEEMQIIYKTQGVKSKYKGGVKNNSNTPVFHGYGTLIQDSNGDIIKYTGQFNNHEQHGDGELIIGNNDLSQIYKKMNGKFVKNIFQSGTIVENYETNDKIHVYRSYSQSSYDSKNKIPIIDSTETYIEKITDKNKNEFYEKLGNYKNNKFYKGQIKQLSKTHELCFGGTFINDILDGPNCYKMLSIKDSNYNILYTGYFSKGKFHDKNGNVLITMNDTKIDFNSEFINDNISKNVSLNFNIADINIMYTGTLTHTDGFLYYKHGTISKIAKDNAIYYTGLFSHNLLTDAITGSDILMTSKNDEESIEIKGSYNDGILFGDCEINIYNKIKNSKTIYVGSVLDGQYKEGSETYEIIDKNIMFIKIGSYVDNLLHGDSCKFTVMHNNFKYLELTGTFCNGIFKKGTIQKIDDNRVYTYTVSNEISNLELSDSISFTGTANLNILDKNTNHHSIYTGTFSHNEPSPCFIAGTFTYITDKYKYESKGTFKNIDGSILLNGKNCTFKIFNNNTCIKSYEGEFILNELMYGKVYIVNNGFKNVYEGYLRKNKFHSYNEISTLTIYDAMDNIIEYYKGRFHYGNFIYGTHSELSNNVIVKRRGKFKNMELTFGDYHVIDKNTHNMLLKINGHFKNNLCNKYAVIEKYEDNIVEIRKGIFEDNHLHGKGCYIKYDKNNKDTTYKKYTGYFQYDNLIRGKLITVT